jgi:hypothetical protein
VTNPGTQSASIGASGTLSIIASGLLAGWDSWTFAATNLPPGYSALTVADLIADINQSNNTGGTNTITLTAPSSAAP